MYGGGLSLERIGCLMTLSYPLAPSRIDPYHVMMKCLYSIRYFDREDVSRETNQNAPSVTETTAGSPPPVNEPDSPWADLRLSYPVFAIAPQCGYAPQSQELQWKAFSTKEP